MAETEESIDRLCEDCNEELDLHCDECGECSCEGECVEDDEDDEDAEQFPQLPAEK